MVISFGIVTLLNGTLCFLSRLYLRDDGDSLFILGLLQLQGWLGLSCCLWGIWEIIYAQLDLGLVVTDLPYWLSILSGGFINVFAGGLLGFAMIQRLTLAQVPAGAQPQAFKLRLDLIQLQVYTSYIAGVLGLWLVYYAFWRG